MDTGNAMIVVAMRSPFPGMDPYLESHWSDVHARLIYLACNEINRQLGGDLRARMGERVGGTADSEGIREPFIEIFDVSSGRRLITVLEFLSPAIEGKLEYQQKQQEVMAAGINMVEIDLTRAGARELLCLAAQLPEHYRTAYLTCVRRGMGADQFEVYRMPLREKLPGIRIPLREADPDAAVDLQRLVDQAYDEGRYDDIDYRVAAAPELVGEDGAWADGVLRGAGKR
jgi:hypothetical protein